MSEDLQKKVERWIDVSGFGLELRAARAFRREEFSVVQSDYYRDPKTGELREIDLVLHADDRITLEQAAVVVPVECKRAADKPWVVLAGQLRLSPQQGVVQRAATGRGEAILSRLQDRDHLWRSELFRLPPILGSSLVVADVGSNTARDNDGAGDRAYKALSGVTAAARAKLVEIQDRLNDAVALAWPLVIIEGRLFQASLASEGSLKVEEVTKAVIAWRNPRLAFHSLVTVVTEPELEKLAPRLKLDIADFVREATVAMQDRR